MADLNQYRYVLAISEHGNITKAARALYISQPSLSVYLQKLESRLGCQLFEKDGKTLALTYCGERFAEYGRKILSLNEKCIAEIDEIATTGATRNRILLGLPNSLSSQLFPRLAAAFKRSCPHVNLVIREAPGRQLEELVFYGDVDMAIFSLPLRSRALDHTVLWNVEFLVAANRKHPICKKALRLPNRPLRYLNQEMLADEPLVVLSEGMQMRGVVNQLFAQVGATPRILMETSNSLTAYQLAIHNVAPTFVTEDLIDPAYDDVMEYFHFGDPCAYMQLGCVYLNRHMLPPVCREFIRTSMACLSTDKLKSPVEKP